MLHSPKHSFCTWRLYFPQLCSPSLHDRYLSTMVIGAVLLLCFLPLQVNGITTDANCLAGYEWVRSASPFSIITYNFSSDVQFDRPKSLRRRSGACSSLCGWWCVCQSYPCSFLTAKYLEFNLEPLDFGYVYSGPTQANQNSCRCSSVYYSLLSACGFCQGRNYLW